MSTVKKTFRVIYAVLLIGVGGYFISEVYPFVWQDFIDPSITNDKSSSQKSAFYLFFFGFLAILYGFFELVAVSRSDS